MASPQTLERRRSIPEWPRPVRPERLKFQLDPLDPDSPGHIVLKYPDGSMYAVRNWRTWRPLGTDGPKLGPFPGTLVKIGSAVRPGRSG